MKSNSATFLNYIPLVSVIIPNYRHAFFLQQRIDSVLSQTYKNIEVIILDDCSPDNSRNIIEQYRGNHKISQIIYNDRNSGSAFKQWKKGIDKCLGDFVWIAESDDYADPYFIEKLLPLFFTNEKIAIVYCDSFIIDGKGKIQGRFSEIKNRFYNTERWSFDYLNDGADEISKYLIKSTTINNASAVLFKKKYLENSINDSLSYYGDVYVYLEILSKSILAYVAQPLNYYRDHSSNATKVSDNNGANISEAMVVFNNLLQKVNLDKQALKRLGQELASRILYLDKSGRSPDYYLNIIDDNKLRKNISAQLKILKLKKLMKLIFPINKQ